MNAAANPIAKQIVNAVTRDFQRILISPKNLMQRRKVSPRFAKTFFASLRLCVGKSTRSYEPLIDRERQLPRLCSIPNPIQIVESRLCEIAVRLFV